MTQPGRLGFNLHGCRALVTGSASGIGLATAGLLARSGAHVAMNELPKKALTTNVAALNGQGLRMEAVPGSTQVAVCSALGRRGHDVKRCSAISSWRAA